MIFETMTIIIGALVALAGYFIYAYNGLVTLRERVKEALADIDVQLKKRYDLLPDLIATAKKAVKVDEDIFTKITALRSKAISMDHDLKNIKEVSAVENQISTAVRGLQIQVEAYPDIKSHGELNKLMDMVTEIEEKISYSRRFYNTIVQKFNIAVKTFPTVLIASLLGFKPADFFEANETEREDIKIDFDDK